MIMVSACLFGVDCKYNGESNRSPELVAALQNEQVVLICPEQSGGLPTPRPPCEIVGGDGYDVLKGTARVMNNNGEDLSQAFIKGAQNVALIAEAVKPDLIILKSRSPSCGVGSIYDGTFTSTSRQGDGVACALLKQKGLKVLSDDEFLSQGRFKK